MRTAAITTILVLVALLLGGLACTDKQPASPYGSIRLVTGPASELIAAEGQYQLRADFAVEPFALGPGRYVLFDSVETQPVLQFADFGGTETTIDSLEPGRYSLFVYVSRLSVNQVNPDTFVTDSGDTVITDPAADMTPYEFYFRPILVGDIHVAADSTALVDLSDQLESWEKPAQTFDGGWEAEYVRYLPWRGRRE